MRAGPSTSVAIGRGLLAATTLLVLGTCGHWHQRADLSKTTATPANLVADAAASGDDEDSESWAAGDRLLPPKLVTLASPSFPEGPRPTRSECTRAFDRLVELEGNPGGVAPTQARRRFLDDCYRRASKREVDCVLAARDRAALASCVPADQAAGTPAARPPAIATSQQERG